MAATTVPISGGVLGWAREEAGLTEADLADRVNLPVEDIRAWEAGSALPTQGQFSKLVTVLRRPSAVFFLPEPPAAAGMPTTLRSAPALVGHKLGPDGARQIRWARRLQELTSWILRDEGRKPVALPQYSAMANPVRPADKERERSGVSVSQQTAWSSASEAFRTWRGYLENRNVLVLPLSMERTTFAASGLGRLRPTGRREHGLPSDGPDLHSLPRGRPPTHCARTRPARVSFCLVSTTATSRDGASNSPRRSCCRKTVSER